MQVKETKMRTRNYKAEIERISQGYETARDCEFDTQLNDFIMETREEHGVVTEDDIQGFIDSFTFKEEFEWCADELELELADIADLKYQQMKDERK